MAIPAKKRKFSDSTSAQKLSDDDIKILELIKSQAEDGISLPQIKAGTKLLPAIIAKSLLSLIARGLIKEFINPSKKKTKHYMGAEFKPSKEADGGEWYEEGVFNKAFVEDMMEICKMTIRKMKVATMDKISNFIVNSGMFKAKVSASQINEIVQALVLDGDVEEVLTDQGVGYRLRVRKMAEDSAMSSIPCGVCPRINDCTPDGMKLGHWLNATTQSMKLAALVVMFAIRPQQWFINLATILPNEFRQSPLRWEWFRNVKVDLKFDVIEGCIINTTS